MSPERPDLPDWARQDRERDKNWIHDNLDIFWPRARQIFEEKGRIAFLVTTPGQFKPAIYEIGYIMQEGVEEYSNDDLKRMVREYEPTREFVLALLKEEGRESCYRIQIQRRGTNGHRSTPSRRFTTFE